MVARTYHRQSAGSGEPGVAGDAPPEEGIPPDDPGSVLDRFTNWLEGLSPGKQYTMVMVLTALSVVLVVLGVPNVVAYSLPVWAPTLSLILAGVVINATLLVILLLCRNYRDLMGYVDEVVKLQEHNRQLLVQLRQMAARHN